MPPLCLWLLHINLTCAITKFQSLVPSENHISLVMYSPSDLPMRFASPRTLDGVSRRSFVLVVPDTTIPLKVEMFTVASTSRLPHHEFASISAQIFFMCSLFFLASSRFCAVRSSLSARRHLLTSRFVSLHIPIAFHMKPLAWHSSRAVMISSHPVQIRVNFGM